MKKEKSRVVSIRWKPRVAIQVQRNYEIVGDSLPVLLEDLLFELEDCDSDFWEKLCEADQGDWQVSKSRTRVYFARSKDEIVFNNQENWPWYKQLANGYLILRNIGCKEFSTMVSVIRKVAGAENLFAATSTTSLRNRAHNSQSQNPLQETLSDRFVHTAN
jgi:hypothetical protein